MTSIRAHKDHFQPRARVPWEPGNQLTVRGVHRLQPLTARKHPAWRLSHSSPFWFSLFLILPLPLSFPLSPGLNFPVRALRWLSHLAFLISLSFAHQQSKVFTQIHYEASFTSECQHKRKLAVSTPIQLVMLVLCLFLRWWLWSQLVQGTSYFVGGTCGVPSFGKVRSNSQMKSPEPKMDGVSHRLIHGPEEPVLKSSALRVHRPLISTFPYVCKCSCNKNWHQN